MWYVVLDFRPDDVVLDFRPNDVVLDFRPDVVLDFRCGIRF